jgi:hypothetical protein
VVTHQQVLQAKRVYIYLEEIENRQDMGFYTPKYLELKEASFLSHPLIFVFDLLGFGFFFSLISIFTISFYA